LWKSIPTYSMTAPPVRVWGTCGDPVVLRHLRVRSIPAGGAVFAFFI
jgi:hypothetical protein